MTHAAIRKNQYSGPSDDMEDSGKEEDECVSCISNYQMSDRMDAQKRKATETMVYSAPYCRSESFVLLQHSTPISI